ARECGPFRLRPPLHVSKDCTARRLIVNVIAISVALPLLPIKIAVKSHLLYQLSQRCLKLNSKFEYRISKRKPKSQSKKIRPGCGVRNGDRRVSATAACGHAGDGARERRVRPWSACARGSRAGVYEFVSMADKCVS